MYRSSGTLKMADVPKYPALCDYSSSVQRGSVPVQLHVPGFCVMRHDATSPQAKRRPHSAYLAYTYENNTCYICFIYDTLLSTRSPYLCLSRLQYFVAVDFISKV
jgi:hypothetical protein